MKPSHELNKGSERKKAVPERTGSSHATAQTETHTSLVSVTGLKVTIRTGSKCVRTLTATLDPGLQLLLLLPQPVRSMLKLICIKGLLHHTCQGKGEGGSTCRASVRGQRASDKKSSFILFMCICEQVIFKTYLSPHFKVEIY